MLSKVDQNNSISFGLIEHFEVFNLEIAKVKKVKIADTYSFQPSLTSACLREVLVNSSF
jgi:hypothetical protein